MGAPALVDKTAGERLLPSGDESGTAPGDRRYRPDVEGLRAVAVLLVVLYHAGVPGIAGGFVGVDVFFVISGFVITGLLLRERQATGRTSILSFYARRCRRILPAATVVILSVVVTTFLVLGVVSGATTAGDGRWAAVFLSNFHFESVGTDYLLSQRPPSPLQNFWSLSIEEQFYLVYPSLFLVLMRRKGDVQSRVRLIVALSLVIVASYGLSISQTAHNPSAAYFSPFTRAWELALGALIAVSVPMLKQIPRRYASLLTWVGFGAILYAAFAFNSFTAYPGSLVIVPVVGSGLVIAGGVAAPRWGAESVLGLPTARWLGRLSYSLYLWHWPILLVVAEHYGKSKLSLMDSSACIAVAVMLSIATYHIVEGPIRHSKLNSRMSVILGACLVAITLILLSLFIDAETTGASSPEPVVPAPNAQVVHDLVAKATTIKKVPRNIEPALTGQKADWGGNYLSPACAPALQASRAQVCSLGDRNSKKLMVVYGDSHVLMWFPAFETIAATDHWQLIVLAKTYCPADNLTIANPSALGSANSPDLACDNWHRWAVGEINRLKPQVLVVSQESIYQVPVANASTPKWVSAPEWENGLRSLYASLKDRNTRNIILGNIPVLQRREPSCLASHRSNVQFCSSPKATSVLWTNKIEMDEAKALGIQYIDTVPWFCSQTCTAEVGNYNVYMDGIHMNATFARYLEGVLGKAINLPNT